MACEISWYHTTSALCYCDRFIFWAEVSLADRTHQLYSSEHWQWPRGTNFSRLCISRVQQHSRETSIFSCLLCRAGALQAHRLWKKPSRTLSSWEILIIPFRNYCSGKHYNIQHELLTLVRNFLLVLLQFSFAAALDWRMLVTTRGGSGGLSSASDGYGSCVLGQQSKSSWPQLVEISKESGHFSSGLDPSSLILALQSIRDLERERNFLDFLFPALFFWSIFRELLLFFLSFSHLCGMILSIILSASVVLNILQERKYKSKL